MTPVLAFALWAIYRAIAEKSQYRPEALCIGVAFAVMVVFYTITTKNYGGLCLGFRWLMPITPMLLAFVPLSLTHNHSRAAWSIFVVGMLIGQYHAFSGLHDPWLQSSWDRWLSS